MNNVVDIKSKQDEVIGLYQELILAVESKFPNETRHETALRYIKSFERMSNASEAIEK